MRADKRQVAVVHVCIANERTKGIQQRGTLVGLGVDVPRRCQRLRDHWPRGASHAGKFGINSGKRKRSATAPHAHSVKALNFQESLAAIVDDFRARSCHASCRKCLQSVVLGQQ